MKTTIDLPEEILHRAKIAAAQRRTTLKELVIQGLDQVINHNFPDPDIQRRKRNQELLAALSKVQITEPVGKINREAIYDRHESRWE